MDPDPVSVAAVDLGASSGRVIHARVGVGLLELEEVHRFPNGPVPVSGRLHWDVLGLWRGVLEGLRAAARRPGGVDAVGVDSWAVDYGLLDASGALLGNPVSYRDARTDGVMERVLEEVGAAHIYAVTGVQFLQFNTIYQLVAAAGTPQLDMASQMLLLPDLIGSWLTGEWRAEVTNASTTQLLDARTRTWSTDLVARVGIDASLLPPLIEPGDRLGGLLPDVAAETGLEAGVPIVAVGSHDTASAVVGVPATTEGFGYVSCGTWSLVGVELDKPVLTEASRVENFSNELGVDGTVRYLRNVMGLWLLQESLRAWERAGMQVHLRTLFADAAEVPTLAAVIDPDDAAFLPPGDMPARIASACERTGQTRPNSPAQVARCILDSLALAYRRVLRQAQRLSGLEIDVVHIVGGGSRNELLCQVTADACGVPVISGPVEATALGNALVQARTLGAVSGTLGDLRALVVASQDLRRYEPGGRAADWAAAETRLA